MGKSTIGAMMENMRIPVHEADKAVHKLLTFESEAWPAIKAAFPFFEYPDIYEKKGRALNRKKFGELIFHDDFLREKLEGILHPLVHKSQNEFIREFTLKGFDMVCLDIPLLFETGAEERLDYTITVSAPYFIQRQRVLERPNMSEEKFHAILERQMPNEQKCVLSDYVIKTGLGRAQSMKELKSIIQDIRKKEFGNTKEEEGNKKAPLKAIDLRAS